MKDYKVSENQSFLDIAIQTSGGIASVFDLAVVNDLSITDDLTPGQSLQLVDLDNADVTAYYKSKNLVPATALTADDKLVAAELEGISYWAINVDFIVQ
jgi:hypothetical protein